MNSTVDRTIRFNSSEQRIFQRTLFQTSGVLRLETGYIIHGNTENLSFHGVYLKTDDDIGNVSTGDKGHFDFILHEGEQELLTRYTCAVARVAVDGIGIKFFDQEVVSSSSVYVRRSNGSLDAGWEIAAPNEGIPDVVKKIVCKKKQEGPCVICIKRGKTPELTSYKVYTVQDLLAIQESAR